MESSAVKCRLAGNAEAFVAGDLTSSDADSFRDHLRACAGCQRLVAELATAPGTGSGAGARRHPAEVVTTAATLTLKETLGSGGMGEVYRATDQQMSRDVALKVMTSAADSSAADAAPVDPMRRTMEFSPDRDLSHARRQQTLEARFLREASITARLQHPSIVPVYQTGRLSSGEPFYTMKLITGRSLKDLIIAAPTLAERLALVPNLLAAADAMAYAHSHGVVHRDLKPSNIMVGAFGETLVIDWGIAKLLTDDEIAGATPSPSPSPSGQITKTGAILGTPSFMAPEQARGEPVDERADVYALGGILQSLLSGRPPQSEPAAPLPREASRELIAIVGRAMAPDPADRYRTAHELAEDLRRFLAGQLVAAHEYSLPTILLRWMRRHRAPLGVAALFLAALAALGFVSIRRVTRARNLAERERAVAVARRNELTLLQARSLLATDPTRALAWLKTYPSDGAAWADVQAIAADAEARGVARHLLPIESADTAAFTPDGRRIVISGIGGWVHVVDAERGATVAKLPIENADVGIVAVAPDGARVAIGKTNGEVALWTIGGKADVVAHHGGLPKWISFARDGRLLVSADFNTLSATDLERHTAALTQRVPRGAISIVQLSHDGRKIAWATSLGDVLVSSLAGGATTTWRGHRGPVNDLAFSDDDALLASAGQDGSVRVWRSDGKSTIVGRHAGGAKNVRFLAHAHRFLSFGADRAIATWDADAGHELARLAGPLEMPHTFAASDDGRLVATADLAGNVEVWDLETRESQRLLVDGEDIIALVFSPSHDWLFGGGSAAHSRLWRMHMRRRKAFPDPEGEIAPHALFAPGGASFATDGGNAVRLCDVAAGTCRVARGEHPELNGISYSPDGKQILSAGTDGTARLWDVATGDARVLARPSPEVPRAIFSPDGKIMAVCSNDGLVRLYRDGVAEPQILRGHTGPVLDLRFTGDSRRLASASADGTARLWDIASGTSHVFTGHEHPIHVIALSPEGRRLAAGSWDGNVWVWDTATAKGTKLVGHTAEIAPTGLAFLDDDSLLSASFDGTVVRWRLASGGRDIFRGHVGRVISLAVAPGGRTFATAGEDKTVRLWDPATGATQVLYGHRAAVRWVTYSDDGKLLASTANDSTVRIWTIDFAPSVPRGIAELRAWLSEATTAQIGELH